MITVCMIVKDEEPIIEKSLKAIKKFGFDIVVVDTGSKDNTKDIASRYTDKIYDYEWNRDFSAARNFAISKMDNDGFILMLDADEVIVDFNKEEAYKLLKLNEAKTGRIAIINEFESSGLLSKSTEKVSRVFSKKYYKYEGAIHEQLVSECGKGNYDFPLKVLHSGYNKSEVKRKNKVKRNLDILNKELSLNPNDPYILYQIGKAYYINDEYENAASYFSKAMDIDLDVSLEYVKELVECYGYCLLNMKMYNESLGLLQVYEVFSGSCDFVFLAGLIYMNNGFFNEAIAEFLKAVKMKDCKVTGVNSFLAFYNIGIIYECLGNLKEAKKYYLECGDYNSALDRLKLLSESC